MQVTTMPAPVGLVWRIAWPPLHEVAPTRERPRVPDDAPGQPPESRRLPVIPFGPRNGLSTPPDESRAVGKVRSHANQELLNDEVARDVAKAWISLGYVGKTRNEGGAEGQHEQSASVKRR
eukprot:2836409-Prymnesium_polylepis.1